MVELDLTAYACPMPLLKLKQAMAQQPDEVEFKVWLTDQGARRDFPAFCQQMGLACRNLADEELIAAAQLGFCIQRTE